MVLYDPRGILISKVTATAQDKINAYGVRPYVNFMYLLTDGFYINCGINMRVELYQKGIKESPVLIHNKEIAENLLIPGDTRPYLSLGLVKFW